MVRFFVDSDFYITQSVFKRGTERMLGIGKNFSSLRRLVGLHVILRLRMLILKMVWGMGWGHVDDDSDNCFGVAT